MTNVRCVKDRGEYQIDIEGHAEYNIGGPDLVCGAVSTLGFTLMSALENKDAVYKIIKFDSGEVHVFIKPTTESQRDVDNIVETVMIGFAMLAEKYPDNVDLEW